MDDDRMTDLDVMDDIGKFVEDYSSFNQILNKLQRQYLSLKETYTRQSDELQAVNQSLQKLMTENRAVTEFLDGILNSLSSGVIAIDRTGQVTLINPAAARLVGLPANDPAEKHYRYADIVRIVEGERTTPLDVISDGRPYDGLEKKIRTAFDTVVILSTSASPLKNADGRVFGAVELLHDITKIRRMEEGLARMKILASLGEMAASIAHEVRNPLAGIKGFASLLARDLAADPEKGEMARKIVEGVDSINLTVQTLLDFARQEKLDKTEINLNEYIDSVIDGFLGEHGPDDFDCRLQLDLKRESDLGVRLDKQLFRQVLCNLIKNGLEAGGEKSRVRIWTEKLPLAQAQKEFADRMGLSGTETLARIGIEDNGPGIPEDEVGMLFSPFYSTKQNGIGLGLSIAWKIIKAHGGDIAVSSKIGRGTRFSIFLPLRNCQQPENYDEDAGSSCR